MKYSKSNPPLVCMMTQSTCYKGTTTMTPKGVLWHSTGANNPTLKRYVQPSDVKPPEDTYSKEEWLKKLGKNTNKNDWNHITRQAGLNAWIGKLADGTVTSIQTMPWNFKPWGCGSGSKGSCNNGWMQFEICEDGLTDKNYFNAVYREACELTAYYCKMYNIDPKGTVLYKGVKVPTILCHQDSYKLSLGGNHSDVYHWFNKHGKTMNDVRNDVAKLLGESAPVTPVVVKEYKVVVDMPTYANAADAKAKKNKKGTYKVGTYYIYNKYPNGVDGMLNISTDKTGNSAGAWINPSENVAPQPVEEQMYRVRKTWTDSKSQKGAFKDLQNAISCCQEAGPGYNVFDKDGKMVYAYIEPEKPKVEEPKQDNSNVAVYDLNYPEKTKIVDPTVIRSDEDCVKAIKAILLNNSKFDVEIAKVFFKLCPKYGIDPVMAIAQSILETGWFEYSGSAVKPEHHNYCGLGVTSNGVTGGIFDTIEDGITAQLQHLFAYGCKDSLPNNETIVDPRFKYVTRGIAPYWQNLAGRWAVPGYDKTKYATPLEAMETGNTYGQKICKLANQIISTQITNSDIEKYFKYVEHDMSEVGPKDDGKGIDTDKVNALLDIFIKFIKLIVNFFKNK